MTKSEQFKEEFKALLRKYRAEMSIREHCCGYATVTDGVDFHFEGEIIDDEYVTYPTAEFGQWENGK